MKNVKFRSKISFLLLPLMVLYVFIPCISQAAPATYASPSVNKVTTINIQPTATLTYFYNRSTLMNAEDDSGNMSTYLDRTVRSIVNVNSQTLLDTQCLFTDGKNVISQTDSTGTNVTSTQQYNAYGQAITHNPNTNSQLSIANNPFQYDGYYYDPESSLYYLNARYYSPTLMQFISMDTYDLANRYGYCDGNPIGNEDQTGHDALGDVEDISEGFIPGYGTYSAIKSLLRGGNIEDDIINSITLAISLYMDGESIAGPIIFYKEYKKAGSLSKMFGKTKISVKQIESFEQKSESVIDAGGNLINKKTATMKDFSNACNTQPLKKPYDSCANSALSGAFETGKIKLSDEGILKIGYDNFESTASSYNLLKQHFDTSYLDNPSYDNIEKTLNNNEITGIFINSYDTKQNIGHSFFVMRDEKGSLWETYSIKRSNGDMLYKWKSFKPGHQFLPPSTVDRLTAIILKLKAMT